ncbi:MAG: 2-oxoacid:acceptor oxidoreductase family protein [Desulfobacteraceae bacterium]|nr:2-oxoacid:acceptor oxidoreductase family protein [Desulfobacteraceae bacterium]
MADIEQIRICGFGGQGVVLAGTILGYAAVLDGKWAAGSNSYGAQARGGAARAEVVISFEPILFPHVIQADVLVALSQGGYDAYIHEVRDEGGMVLYDNMTVRPRSLKGTEQLGVPATFTAVQDFCAKEVANMVILAASVGLVGMVSHRSLKTSLMEQVGERFREVNMKALEAGLRLGIDLKRGG